MCLTKFVSFNSPRKYLILSCSASHAIKAKQKKINFSKKKICHGIPPKKHTQQNNIGILMSAFKYNTSLLLALSPMHTDSFTNTKPKC